MSAKQNELLGVAAGLVDYGRQKGASEIEVRVRQGTEFRVSILEQNVDNLVESGFKTLGVRVLVDGKVANASSSDFSPDTLHRIVDNAIARAAQSGKDPYAGLPELEKLQVKPADLQIYDPAVAELAPEKKVAMPKQAEAVGLADKRIKKSLGASLGSFDWQTMLVNSKGFSGAYRRSLINCSVAFQCGEGENLFQEGWDDSSTHVADLWQPEAIARRAVERATRLIGGRKVPTQNVPMVIDPSMSAGLLRFFAQCANGVSIARRQSFLADKLGTPIGNELVNIVDDGLLVRGRGTTPFDDEGVPCRKLAVVERGVLKSYLLDTYWGRKLKLASTGNGGGANNLYWVAGTSTPEEIIRSVDNGLYLMNTIGLGREATTGDISLGAFGMWIEKGELAYPVAEITISTSLGKLLQTVQMVGNDLDLRDSVCGPTIKFAEVTVGGKAAASS
jgi:PmbA protein